MVLQSRRLVLTVKGECSQHAGYLNHSSHIASHELYVGSRETNGKVERESVSKVELQPP